MKIILIAAGGAIGSVCRFLLSSRMTAAISAATFPAGTFTVNAAGSFLIGLLWAFADAGSFSSSLRFFIFTGILGGFTTFSAFSAETMNLFRSGETGMALMYVLLSNVACIALACLGFYSGKFFVAR
jgi:CrcB protein